MLVERCRTVTLNLYRTRYPPQIEDITHTQPHEPPKSGAFSFWLFAGYDLPKLALVLCLFCFASSCCKVSTTSTCSTSTLRYIRYVHTGNNVQATNNKQQTTGTFEFMFLGTYTHDSIHSFDFIAHLPNSTQLNTLTLN